MAERIIEPEAEAELEEAGDRYEESVPGLGLDFLLEMRERTLGLAEAPLRHPVFGAVACGALMPLGGFRTSSSTCLWVTPCTCSRSCIHDDVRGTGRTEARCGSDDLVIAWSGSFLSRGDEMLESFLRALPFDLLHAVVA
jgi:hypothetical protein